MRSSELKIYESTEHDVGTSRDSHGKTNHRLSEVLRDFGEELRVVVVRHLIAQVINEQDSTSPVRSTYSLDNCTRPLSRVTGLIENP